jgi:4-aminobutyrate aminotransferase/(S)-3-amino-2-methylpropionate transaminase
MTNEELLEKRNREVPRGIAFSHPIIAARAKGVRLWDVEGREYLDFTSGISVMNVGHQHPHVIGAIERQLHEMIHTCFQVAMYEPYIELAARLNVLVGGKDPFRTMFLSTGAEATENAVKIARAFTNRPAIIAFDGGFHGRTLMGMSLTASSTSYRQNFGPFAPDIYHAPFPYEYRGWSVENSLAHLDHLFATVVAPERVAGIIIEPQLGEGGFVPAPPEFLRQLRRITTQHGIAFIADEIQTGFGRTGRMFAFQHAGIEPDLVTIAKSIAGGLPLSAVVGKAEFMDAPLPGGLGGTFAGNPLACAAGLAVLEVFEREDLVARAAAIGGQLREGLLALQNRFPSIGDVRGLGAMLAIELVQDRETKVPDPANAQKVLDAARERGLLLLKCGPHKNVLRFLPPLVATSEDIALGTEIAAAAMEETTR